MWRPILAAVLAAHLLAACTSNNQPGASSPKTHPPEIRGATPAARTDPAPATQPATSPDALAMTTAAYAQEIQQHVERRQTRPVSPPLDSHASPALAPVRWLEPSGYELRLMPSYEAHAPQPPRRDEIVPNIGSSASLKAIDPGPAPRNQVVISPPTPATHPTQPPASPESQYAVAAPDPVETQLDQQVRRNPADLSAQLEYHLFQWLRGRDVTTLQGVSALSREDREVLLAILDALGNFRANARSGANQLLADKIRPLVEMSDRLRVQTSLRIPTVQLCRGVQSFGVYEPVDVSHLAQMREHPFILYCEVENFTSRLNAQKFWETNLTEQITLLDAQGKRIWTDKRHPIADISRNRRRDFFIAREVRLPALRAGQYTLMVSISDTQSNLMAEASIIVEVGS